MECKMTSDVDPQGQFWLPGVPAPCCNRVVDVCLRKLCQTFCEQCPPPTVSPLPSQLDDISLACLLLADEWGNRSPEATSVALAACLRSEEHTSELQSLAYLVCRLLL